MGVEFPVQNELAGLTRHEIPTSVAGLMGSSVFDHLPARPPFETHVERPRFPWIRTGDIVVIKKRDYKLDIRQQARYGAGCQGANTSHQDANTLYSLCSSAGTSS